MSHAAIPGKHLFPSVCLVGIFCGSLLATGCEMQAPGDKPVAEKQAAEKQSTRVTFQELFAQNGSMVTPKKIIRVGPTTMTPEVPFDIQVMQIDGAPFAQIVGHDAEIRQANGICEIVKFY